MRPILIAVCALGLTTLGAVGGWIARGEGGDAAPAKAWAVRIEKTAMLDRLNGERPREGERFLVIEADVANQTNVPWSRWTPLDAAVLREGDGDTHPLNLDLVSAYAVADPDFDLQDVPGELPPGETHRLAFAFAVPVRVAP